MKHIFFAAILGMTLTVSVQIPGVSCTYDTTGDISISHCTWPDGSGADTWDSPSGHSETNYAPSEWTKRLSALAKADTEYVTKMKAMRDYWALLNNSHTKKECESNKGGWISGRCYTRETYIESSRSKRECTKRGGAWTEPLSCKPVM